MVCFDESAATRTVTGRKIELAHLAREVRMLAQGFGLPLVYELAISFAIAMKPREDAAFGGLRAFFILGQVRQGNAAVLNGGSDMDVRWPIPR